MRTSAMSAIGRLQPTTDLAGTAARFQTPLLYPRRHVVSVAHSRLLVTPDGVSLPGPEPAVQGPSLIGRCTCSPAGWERD